MKLVVATTNRHKLAEARTLLAGSPYTVDAMTAWTDVPPPDETGVTFVENARIKAMYYGAVIAHPTVAEDSGLEIARLDGAPGVHSARYPGATYPDKFARLYTALRARGFRTSPARFVCALALVESGRIVYETTGTIDGELAPEPRGAAGFGYDPIFFYPPFRCTLAEVPPERKAAVSHRGQAFRALREHLRRRH